MKRVMFIGALAMLCGTAQAEQDHAVTPEPGLLPVVTREVCTTRNWGFGEIRTDCRSEVSVAPEANPALKGICTIYYGRRTCY